MTPQGHELHRIADALQAVQKRNFWQLQAEISHRGRYCHPYSMDITVTRNSPTGQAMTADAEAAVSEALRDLAFWLYRQLENEYDWLTQTPLWMRPCSSTNTPSPKPVVHRLTRHR